MLAVFKREFKAYFTTPLGYVYLGIFYGLSALFFYLFALAQGSADLSGVFLILFFVLMIILPLLTMRLMADENKLKTDQLILTSPVSLFRVVMGKFLAAYAIYAIGLVMILFYGIVLSCFAEVAWMTIFGNLVGILLLGGVFISGGLFVSTLTENQMIAALGSFFINLALMLIEPLAQQIPASIFQDAMSAVSVYSKYYELTLGIFNLNTIIFFLSIMLVFLFFTVRALEKRRWA